MFARRQGRRRFLVAAAVLAATGLIGVAPAAQSAQPPLPQVFAKTAQAKSFRFTFTLSIAGGAQLAPGVKRLALRGTGAVDTRSSSAQVDVNLGALAAVLGGATGGAQVPSTLRLIVLKQALYLRFPALAQQVAPGKEWLKLEASKLPKSSTGGADLSRLGQVNPKQVLSSLQAALKMKKLGSGTVRGVRATHYRATIDLARIVSALPGPQQADARKALKQAGLTTIPADMWVDASGFLRRLVTSLRLKAQGSTVALRLSLDLFDFDEPVRIVPPPAAQVADGTQLLAQLLGGLAGTGKPGP